MPPHFYPARLWRDMPSSAFRALPANTIAILPVGAIEQHVLVPLSRQLVRGAHPTRLALSAEDGRIRAKALEES